MGLEEIAGGIIARIGESGSYIEHKANNCAIKKNLPIHNHKEGLKLAGKFLTKGECSVIKDLSEISAVGHRVVHGGDTFTEPTLINSDVIQKIKECSDLAPLHNPANLIGIETAINLLPDVPHVAVFDTAFHQTLPEKAYLYALPYEFYTLYKIRKYGFHGISCKYTSRRAAMILNRPISELKMIVCHLGNGVTVDAIKYGKSIDTSMGFTPLEGLIMGTRCGDLDSGVLIYLLRKLNLSVQELDDLLNKKSGLLGISGVSNDVRDIIKSMNEGNERCKLALEMFAYRVKKYIGAYMAILGGLDVLVFTAGIGESSPFMRSMICRNLDILGIILDENVNSKVIGTEGLINAPNSKVKVLVIPTNEEKEIALTTMEIVQNVKFK
jgi:acetate kinase